MSSHERRILAASEGIAELGASIFARGLTPGRTGNLSCRIQNEIVVTPTGVSLGSLDPDQLAIIDLDGRPISGARPSKEAVMHAALYRARPTATGVVHLHSTHAVAVSCLADVDERSALPPFTAYFAMRVGHLPLLPYFAPGDPSLSVAVEEMAREHHAILLANHGSLVVADDLLSAADAAEEIEETARLWLLLRHQSTRPLTRAQFTVQVEARQQNVQLMQGGNEHDASGCSCSHGRWIGACLPGAGERAARRCEDLQHRG